jgi:hypothetical protein
MLCLALAAAACGGSDPVMVDVAGVAQSLSITVDYLDGGPPAGATQQLELAVGDSVRLSASGMNALGFVLGDVAVAWSSSDVSILDVSAQAV